MTFVLGYISNSFRPWYINFLSFDGPLWPKFVRPFKDRMCKKKRIRLLCNLQRQPGNDSATKIQPEFEMLNCFLSHEIRMKISQNCVRDRLQFSGQKIQTRKERNWAVDWNGSIPMKCIEFYKKNIFSIWKLKTIFSHFSLFPKFRSYSDQSCQSDKKVGISDRIYS